MRALFIKMFFPNAKIIYSLSLARNGSPSFNHLVFKSPPPLATHCNKTGFPTGTFRLSGFSMKTGLPIDQERFDRISRKVLNIFSSKFFPTRTCTNSMAVRPWPNEENSSIKHHSTFCDKTYFYRVAALFYDVLFMILCFVL